LGRTSTPSTMPVTMVALVGNASIGGAQAVANCATANPAAVAATDSEKPRASGKRPVSGAVHAAAITVAQAGQTGGSLRREKYQRMPTPIHTGSQSAKRPLSAVCQAASQAVHRVKPEDICCTQRSLPPQPLHTMNARARSAA